MITTDKKDYFSEINAHLLSKAIPIIAKRLLLDNLLKELLNMLSNERIEQAVREANDRLSPQSEKEITAKYIDIILSKGKTANVKI